MGNSKVRRALTACALCLMTLGTVTGTSSGVATAADPSTMVTMIAMANVGRRACSVNTAAGIGYASSCVGAAGYAEDWCSDFVRWVWDEAGYDTTGLTAWAADFAQSPGKPGYGPVHANPSVGDAVLFNLSGNYAAHVALVVGVSGGSIHTVSGNMGSRDPNVSTVSDDGWYSGAIGTRIPGYSVAVSGYVTPRPATGSLVAYGGNYYTVAGGALFVVTNWAALGRTSAPGDVTQLSAAQWSFLQFNQPKDGTKLYTAAGAGYVVVGGAATFVSKWANVGGSAGAVLIDSTNLSSSRLFDPQPANGTKLYTAAGPGYVVAGGAALYVAGWANVGGAAGAELIDPAAFGQFSSVPASGTKLYTATGPGYVVAGGAALYVAGWANVGGAAGAVLVDPAGFAKLASRPVDGTKLYVIQGSGFFMTGGYAHFVSAWSSVGGSSGAVLIDGVSLSNLLQPSS